MLSLTRSRGSLIVSALLLFAILLALGLGLMSAQAARMKVAQSQTKALQAKALCDAAWEDVRVKLGKDILFPLPVDGQEFFAYSEDVSFTNDAGVEEPLGSYTVVIDFKVNAIAQEQPGNLAFEPDITIPQGIFGITCIGKVGPRAATPEAEREMYYEVLMTDPNNLNRSFSVIRAEDKSSL